MLKSLRLDFSKKEGPKKDLAKISNLKFLENLALIAIGLDNMDNVLTAITVGCKKLQTLHLEGKFVERKVLLQLYVILIRCVLSACSFTNRGINTIINRSSNLIELDIILCNSSLQLQPRSKSNLKVLRIKNCSDIRLRFSETFQSLKEFHLLRDETYFTNEAIAGFCASCPNLELVSLDGKDSLTM